MSLIYQLITAAGTATATVTETGTAKIKYYFIHFLP
jgi:hypothetical protein